MADRFPLIVDSSSQQIKELPDGDSLLLGDGERLKIGDGNDLNIYHNGTNSIIQNLNANNLIIQNDGDDSDIIFRTDDGSGGVVAYMAMDGGSNITTVHKNMRFDDSVKLLLGSGTDLQAYHDGSNSYLVNSTGDLYIRDTGGDIYIQGKSGESSINVFNDGAVELFYDNSKKIETSSSGMALTGDLAGNGAPFTISNTSNGNNIDIKTTSGGSLVHALKIHSGGRVEAKLSANIAQVALTSSSNAVAWDSAAAANAYYATTENTTFAAPSNSAEGAIISVEIAQGSSAYTVAWNTVFEFAASTAPTVTATANKTDIFSFRYNGSVWQEIGRVQNLAQT